MLATDKTQQMVADEIGWSRDKVARYAVLENISPIAWKTIVTEFSNIVTDGHLNGVTKSVTVVTEGLLRNILNPIAWNEIVTDFLKSVTYTDNDDGTKKVTNGTENLLRNILPLTEYHQNKIISELVSGKIKPAQVKHLSTTYAERESLAEHAIELSIGRRNLTPDQMSLIRGRRYNRMEQCLAAGVKV